MVFETSNMENEAFMCILCSSVFEIRSVCSTLFSQHPCPLIRSLHIVVFLFPFEGGGILGRRCLGSRISSLREFLLLSVHCCVDGLAIGASFLAGRQVGWITTVAVLFHEVSASTISSSVYSLPAGSACLPARSACVRRPRFFLCEKLEHNFID